MSVTNSFPDRTINESHEASATPHGSTSRPNIIMAQSFPKGSSNDVSTGFSDPEVQGRDSLATGPTTRRSSFLMPITNANSYLGCQDDSAGNAENVLMSDKASVAALQPSQDETKELGVSFDDLVDRLISQPMLKSDAKFVAIFLCLYRKFAAPLDLMSAIMHRFKQLNKSEYPQILRVSSQLRYLNILAQWISGYPGDFAHVLTRGNMASFITSLAGNRVFSIASKEMSYYLDVVSEDDDTEWGCSDNNRSRASTVESFRSRSSVQSTTLTLNADLRTEDTISESNPEQEMMRQSTRSSATPSTSSSADRSASQSTGSFQTLLNSVENAQRQAQLLNPLPRNALTKVQWHYLMDTSDNDIAGELTRIDWILFSSIKPRDLVRHVILPADQKEKCKSLENVNRMINQFNHVAFWVANMILLRNKAKHRAKALEKFMGVAWVSQV